MARQIHTVRVTSAEEAVKKIDHIAELFEKYGVLVIKGHKFLVEEQFKIAKLLGDKYDWNVKSTAGEDLLQTAFHVGGQSIEEDKDYSPTKDEYMLDYHIEQTYFIYPPVAGLWCMDKFLCPPGHGNTKFIDSNEIYNLLSKDEQDFLGQAVFVWDKPANSEIGPFYNKAIEPHPVTGIPIIRIESDGGCYILPTLYSISGKTPTEEQSNKFQEIVSKLKTILYSKEDMEYVQEWEEGDFLIVDLFRMYHAVMGGFNYQERIMAMIVTSYCPEKNASYNIKPELQEI
jgi:alpha-ketoglutarate-dependent taurine dioxygenase